MDENLNALSGLGPEDMAIPEISLVQHVGGTDAKEAGAQPGDLYCNVTGVSLPPSVGMNIVIVRITKQRTYWGRDEISDEPPICSSIDGKISSNGDVCEMACPFKAYTATPWTVSASERRAMCLPSYTILGIDHSNSMPVLIRAGGISAQAVRELNSVLIMNRKLHGEYYRALVHVGSVKKRTASGEAFAFTFRLSEMIQDQELIAQYREEAAMLIGVQLTPLEQGQGQESPAVPPVTDRQPSLGLPRALPVPEPPLPPEPGVNNQKQAVSSKETRGQVMTPKQTKEVKPATPSEPMPDIDSLSDF
jgi:hypothetical protein